jgi:hypothetical protein
MSSRNTSSSKKNETTICLPGEDGWEHWKPTTDGYTLAGSVSLEDEGSPESFKEIQVYGFPVTAAFAVPVWASTADEQLLDSVVDMQLEKIGMKPEAIAGKLVDYSVVDREENQTLILATVLEGAFQHKLPPGGAKNFEASPALYYLPENQITLWKELGKIVVAVTRRDNLVYFQALTATRVDATAVHELNCLMMQLGMQNVVEQIDGITLWTSECEDGVDVSLSDAFECRVHRQAKPAPVLPLEYSKLLPTEVALERIEAKKRQKIKQLLTVAALVYVGVASFFVLRYAIDYREVKNLRADAASKQYYFDLVPRVQKMWGVARLTMNVDRYPMEVFRLIVEPLLEMEQVRIDKFNVTPDSVTISGFAQTADLAIGYQQAVKLNKELQDFDWTTKPPKPDRRTKTASFEIGGKLIK